MAPASAGDFRDIVYDYFLERHIALKPDWFDAAISYLDLKAKPTSVDAVCALVFEQWRYADLALTTYPTLRPIHNNHFRYEGNSVLQVDSCMDIATSALSQFKQCTSSGMDNAEFSSTPTSEREETPKYEPKVKRMLKLRLSDGEGTIEAIEYQPISWLKPTIFPGSKILFTKSVVCRRGILMLTPDNCQKLGGQVAKLFSTNLLTSMLAKKLNKKLKVSNAVPGPSLPCPAPSSRPPAMVAPSTSGIVNVSRSANRSVTAPKTYSFGMTAENPIVLSESPDDHRRSAFPRCSTPNVRARPPTPEESLAMVMSIDDDFSNDAFNFPSHHMATVEEESLESALEHEEAVPETPPLEDSFMNDDLELFLTPDKLEKIRKEQEELTTNSESDGTTEPPAKKSAPNSVFDSVYPERGALQDSANEQSQPRPVTREPSPSPWTDDEEDFVKPSPRISNSQSHTSWKAPAKKVLNRKKPPQVPAAQAPQVQESSQTSIQSFFEPKVKTEKVESDDDITILSPVKQEAPEDLASWTTPFSTKNRSVGSIASPAISPFQSRPPREEDSRLARDPFVLKYMNLSLSTIAASVKFMRFAVGSKRFDIIAVVKEIVKPLRVVDDQWSMDLLLEDETQENFECVVSHSLLCDLIGLTPHEAAVIRNSTDKQKKRDGQRRINSTKEQLARLDLIFTIELFAARAEVTPIVYGVDTLTSKLFSS